MGSESSIRLPAADEVSQSVPRRIVVIDDSRIVAQLFCEMLAELGHDVAWEHNPENAIDIIRRHRAEVVFSDISMPGLNGHDLARRIRGEPEFRTLVLVAMTGFGYPEDVRLSHEAGFDHHLVKPADFNAIRIILDGMGDGRPAVP